MTPDPIKKKLNELKRGAVYNASDFDLDFCVDIEQNYR